VPTRRKAALLARSLAAILPRADTSAAPALAAARYLVDAASAPALLPKRFRPFGPIESRAHWVLDLFERLQQQELGTPWSMLGRWEWIIIEVVVLGFLIVELVSVRRSITRDKAQRANELKAASSSQD
jgi:hypothetical protein